MMEESKVKHNNYITILGWMVSELGLKGNALLIYAIIYGFSQSQDMEYSGSRQYLAEWTNSTVQSVSKCLKKLTDDGFLIKKDVVINNIRFCKYKAVVPSLKPNTQVSTSKQSLLGVGNFVDGGSKQSLPNNLNIILDNINNNIYSANEAFEEFWEIYPRKVNKKKAKEKFIKLCKDKETFRKIVVAIKKQKASKQWKDINYIPHPSTWLNGERWNDVVDHNITSNSINSIGEVLG